jgi:hypothetical protein
MTCALQERCCLPPASLLAYLGQLPPREERAFNLEMAISREMDHLWNRFGSYSSITPLALWPSFGFLTPPSSGVIIGLGLAAYQMTSLVHAVGRTANERVQFARLVASCPGLQVVKRES